MSGFTSRNSTSIVHHRVNDPLRFLASATKLSAGDCQTKSLQTWFKMRKVGAKRMRGSRFCDRRLVGEGFSKYHYFVVNKGMIFDESMGITQISPAADYYRESEMQDIQEADYGAWFAEELPGEPALDANMRDMCVNPAKEGQLKSMIDTLMEHDEKDLLDASGNMQMLTEEQLIQAGKVVCPAAFKKI
jgi:hypothetical protein